MGFICKQGKLKDCRSANLPDSDNVYFEASLLDMTRFSGDRRKKRGHDSSKNSILKFDLN